MLGLGFVPLRLSSVRISRFRPVSYCVWNLSGNGSFCRLTVFAGKKEISTQPAVIRLLL